MKKMNVQLVMAVLLCAAGITLVFSGFWIAPAGEIHNSVLVAFGGTRSFAEGCLERSARLPERCLV